MLLQAETEINFIANGMLKGKILDLDCHSPRLYSLTFVSIVTHLISRYQLPLIVSILPGARIYRRSFRENKLKTLVFDQ